MVATNLVRLGKRRVQEQLTIAPSTDKVIDDLHARVTADLDRDVEAIAKDDESSLAALLIGAHEVPAMRDAAMSRRAGRLVDRGSEKVAHYAREVELIAHLYRVHALTRRLARAQLSDAIDAGDELF